MPSSSGSAAALLSIACSTLFAQVFSETRTGIAQNTTPGQTLSLAQEQSAGDADQGSARPASLSPGLQTVAKVAMIPLDTEPELHRRFVLGVRASFLLPQNDLKLTTGSFPQLSAGVKAELRLRHVHRL